MEASASRLARGQPGQGEDRGAVSLTLKKREEETSARVVKVTGCKKWIIVIIGKKPRPTVGERLSVYKAELKVGLLSERWGTDDRNKCALLTRLRQHNKVTGLILRGAPSFVILTRLSFGYLAPIMMNNGVFGC